MIDFIHKYTHIYNIISIYIIDFLHYYTHILLQKNLEIWTHAACVTNPKNERVLSEWLTDRARTKLGYKEMFSHQKFSLEEPLPAELSVEQPELRLELLLSINLV